MNLSNRNWHTRWFHYVQSKLGSTYRYSSGTNLCHYIRVCFLWGGLLVVFWTTITAGFGFLVFVAPFYGLWAGPIFVGTVGSAVLTAYVIFRLIGRYGETLAPVGSVIHCAYEHAKSVKGQFCPIVKFDAR